VHYLDSIIEEITIIKLSSGPTAENPSEINYYSRELVKYTHRRSLIVLIFSAEEEIERRLRKSV